MYEIEANNGIMSEVFTNKESYDKALEQRASDKEKFTEIVNSVKAKFNVSNHQPQSSNMAYENFCSHIQYLILSPVRKEDFPHGIWQNCPIMKIKIDMNIQKIEIIYDCCFELLPEDKKKSYMYGCPMKKVAKFMGYKLPRKKGYKNVYELTEYVVAKYNEFIEMMEEFTTGYPYHDMKVSIY